MCTCRGVYESRFLVSVYVLSHVGIVSSEILVVNFFFVFLVHLLSEGISLGLTSSTIDGVD